MSAKLPPLRYLAGTAHGGLKNRRRCFTSACQNLIEKSCVSWFIPVFIWVSMFMEWSRM
jgi:hypothetical protein